MRRSLRLRGAVGVGPWLVSVLAACAGAGDQPGEQSAPEFGVAREALVAQLSEPGHVSRGDGHEARDGRGERHWHRGRGHHGHAGRGECERDPPEDPVVFTPASAAARTNRRAGVAVLEGPLAAEPRYGELIAANFNAVTPENAMKWGPLQPESPQTWDFAGADAIVDFAEAEGLAIKGHTLIWHQQLPPFVDEQTEARQLARQSARHINRTRR